MSINIKKLKASNRPFANINTSIGELYLFEIRVKEAISIEKKIGRKLNVLQSEDFFKKYLPLFAYLKQDLIGKKLKRPEVYTLKSEEIEQITKDELEEIAKLFIEKHAFLYTDWKSSRSKREDGTYEVSLKKEVDTSLLKKKNETYIDYVHRVVLAKHKKDMERAKKMFSSFSTGLSKDILKTMGIGESLKSNFNSIENISKMFETTKSKNVFQPIVEDQFKIPKNDIYKQQIENQEKRRLAPFKDLSSKMELMIETEKQTVSFMSDTYETQVQIASELKASSDSANENSKLNIKYTRWIIGLTIFSALITAIAFAYSIWFDNSSTQLIQSNKNIKSSIVETNKKLEKLTNVLTNQNKIQSIEIGKLQEEIKEIKNRSSSKDVSDKNTSKK